MPGFTPMEMTGPIYAFDGTVQVGARDIQVSQAPEPAALAPVGLGLAGLATTRRRKQKSIPRRHRPRPSGVCDLCGSIRQTPNGR
jgi:hypothetical protein